MGPVMNAMQESKADTPMPIARPLRAVADVERVGIAPVPGFEPAGPFRTVFTGQDLHLLINPRNGSYLIALHSAERQAILAGQRAEQLAMSLDRIFRHFTDIGNPSAEERFVRLVEVVLSGFLPSDASSSSRRISNR